MRFQYSLIISISEKINRKKIFIWGNGSFWAAKLQILITLDPLEEVFLDFAQWKELTGRRE